MLGKWDSHALGMGFFDQKAIENRNGIKIVMGFVKTMGFSQILGWEMEAALCCIPLPSVLYCSHHRTIEKPEHFSSHCESFTYFSLPPARSSNFKV